MDFGSDPVYQAALDAAARSSLLAATTSGLSSLSLSPLPPPPQPPPPAPSQTRQLSSNAPRGLTDAGHHTHLPAGRHTKAPQPAAAAEEDGPPAPSPPPANRDTSASFIAQPGQRPRAGCSGEPQPGPAAGTAAKGPKTGFGKQATGAGAGAGAGAVSERQQAQGQRRGSGSAGSDRAAASVKAHGPVAEAEAAEQLEGMSERAKGAASAATKDATVRGRAAAGKRAAPAARKDGQWFGAYYEHLDQGVLSQGLKGGRLFRGKIRINPNNPVEAYVTVPGLPSDLLVRGDLSRNRAVEGDEVAVEVQPTTAWFVVRSRAQLPEGAAAGAGADAASVGAKCPWQAASEPEEAKRLISGVLVSRPELRATAKVVAILSPSPKRDHLVGLLRLAPHRHPDPDLPHWDPAAESKLPPGRLAAAVEALLATDVESAAGGGAAGAGGLGAGSGAGSSLPAFQLVPLDPRLPTCGVRAQQLFNMSPALLVGLIRGEEEAGRTLVSGLLRQWPSASPAPLAALRASLGQAGEIESETAALLEAEAIRCGEFEAEVMGCLPRLPWRVRPEDLEGRRDFRSHRVFSIDPPTAKDLDDALSIEPLPADEGGGWRVGVHIADVSHFIPPFSPLDVEAGRRATSTYLVQRVVPMLPPLLCEQLCSLNPGEERLTFSVVWDMDDDGTIRSTWFGRSVIRSCAKLTYPLVQRMIEGSFEAADTGVPLHGEGVSWEQLVGDSLALWSLARRLREGRCRGGALRLDNTRLFFSLDRDGNPVATAPYVQKEANQLVEEFMLAANISVARFISGVFPDRAMLRRHPPPNPNKMVELQAMAAAAGLELDVSSAGSLQTTLAVLRASAPPLIPPPPPPPPPAPRGDEGDDDGEVEGHGGGEGGEGLMSAAARHLRKVDLLVMMATRPMQLAQYFSTGDCEESCELWRHYALAVDRYTHFTSPIRRYPDVVVHRLLAAALDVTQGRMNAEAAAAKHGLLNRQLTALVADHCNNRRLAARDAQDASLRLYLCVLLRAQPRLALGTVSSLAGASFFSAYLTEFGTEVTVRLEEAGVPLKADWNPGAKVLSLSRGSVVSGSGFLGRKRHGHQGGRGQGHGRGGGGGSSSCSDGGGGGGNAGPSLAEWVELLPPVRNPHGLQPVSLPLHVRVFGEVPLLLTAELVAGQPPQLAARIYLAEAEVAVEAGQRRLREEEEEREEKRVEKAAVAAVKDAEGVEAGLQPSMVPWESMLQD